MTTSDGVRFSFIDRRGFEDFILGREPDDRLSGEEFDAWLNEVKAETLRDIQRALAGEDTVEWSREAWGSCMAYPWVMEVIDDAIAELSEEG